MFERGPWLESWRPTVHQVRQRDMKCCCAARRAHHLPTLRTLLDIRHQLLLLLFQLCPLSIQFPCGFLQRPLMLPETFRRRQAFAEEHVLDTSAEVSIAQKIR